ncbi:MAG: hypothetical protein KKA42_07135 [candidate division Zixibacteria bacterium]|nr:hypothetical protein [candidate division Zixibacteria bacterium]
MKTLATLMFVCCLAVLSTAQDNNQTAPVAPETFGLEHLSEYLGLVPDDISFRSDYTEPDSFRLQIVADLMVRPLGMIDYLTELKNAHVKAQPEILAGILHSDMKGEYQTGRRGPFRPDVADLESRYNLFYTDPQLNHLLSRAASYIDIVIPRSTEMMLAPLSRDQRAFLTTNFKELLVTREDEEFLSPQAMDSLERLEEDYAESFVEFGQAIDRDPLVAAGIDCLRDLLLDLNGLRSGLRSGALSVKQLVEGTGYLPDNVNRDSYLGMQPGWKIGGAGNDYYSGDYKFILDFGGDDVYDLSYDPKKPHPVIIIDLSGNDHYRARTDFALGSGCLSTGVLLDFGGDDRYDGKSFGLGSAFFGLGILYDADGDDRYNGDTHVEGAGTFGIGLLIDEGGRDTYNAALYSEGFGFVRGAGIIYDVDGSDSYYAGGKYKDILRYDDHYLSLSQGFGYGLRPWMSGGIGAIIDIAGNDNYYADIFAQGCAYWWAVGMIYDSSGLDNYQAFQYAQGTATHMALGLLIDDYGEDVYFGKGLMQGCGHDYSAGIILDRHGNDIYTAYDLSQAAGSANGAGVLIDNEGDDRYYTKSPEKTQGYGNPRRDFGSIGLFIDLGGQDQYLGNGFNNRYWTTPSKWGGGMDIELNPPDTTGGEQ